MTRRRRTAQYGVLLAVVGMAVGIVVAAVLADGRTDVRAATNDGGAWVIRRSNGMVGHVNHAALEATGAIGVSAPGSAFDVEQSGTSVAVNDVTAHSVLMIDDRTFTVVNRLQTPADSHIALTPGGGVVWTENPLSVYRVSRADLGQLKALGAAKPLVNLKGRGLAVATDDGSIWVVDPAGHRAGLVRVDSAQAKWFDLGDAATRATQLTTVGSALVIGGDGAGVTVVDVDGHAHQIVGVPPGSRLGVPAPANAPLAAVTPDGTLLSAAISGNAATAVGKAPGSGPIAPIAFGGCVYAVVTAPPTFTISCGGAVKHNERFTGSTGTALRLRLVNGWVWANDLDTGALLVSTTSGAVDRIDDWGKALSNNGQGDQESTQKGDNPEQRNNPDADNAKFKEADEVDQDGINEPPVAHDDKAQTRVDTPVVVKVLTNDVDPDGDVILVSGVSGQPPGVLVTPTSSRSGVQVTPPAGFAGEISLRYTISDGRSGSAEAAITVDVAANNGTNNRPPVAVTDVAEARAGSSASFNALNNDSDPDGDGLVLQSVAVESGTVVFDPSGQVTLTPDPTASEGTVTASYVVADTFGATTPGTIRVKIRLQGSNNPPDARNDSAVTSVGKPITLNVLANDTDPDNDPMSVAAPPEVVYPPGAELGALGVSLSADGQFFFAPTQAGSFVFRYSVIDGSQTDTAIIRVDVDPAAENRPPIAVRDDVTVSRGGSRMVYVLQNDSDPDGDIVALTGWTPVTGLTIEDVRGVGLRVTAAADAPSQLAFQYTVSDGRSDPVSGVVVVSMSSVASVDQAPIARPDIVEVRAGQTVAVPVLVNDYDPEGTPIKIASVSTAPSATIKIGPGAQALYVSVAPTAVTGFSFGYDIVDQAGNRSASLVQVRLVPAGQRNRPPVPRSDVARTRSGQTVTIPVLANDSDPDGDAIRVESIAAQPAFGVAVANLDGTVSYSAAPDHSGTDHFRYVVVDANGDRAIGDVLVGVMPVGVDNVPPTAADDSYTVAAGGDPIALDVLANDYDADGDSLSITRAVGNSPIDVSQARDGLVFTPPVTVTGGHQAFTVVYTAADGRGGSDDATVTIDVVSSLTPIPPVAVDDVVGPLRPGQTITADLLGNDIDPDGSRAALQPVSTDPAIVFGADRKATITAGVAPSKHQYSVTDASGLTATAQVTVIVTGNVAPQPPPISVETPAGKTISIDIGRQVNDPDGDSLFFTCCDGARHGTAGTTATSAGALTVNFVPDSDFAGPAGFSYTVDDQHGHLVSGAVLVKVTAPANRPPVATDIAASVEAGTVGAVSLATAVSDPDAVNGDTLTFTLIDAPSSMTLAGSTVNVDAPIDSGGATVTARYRVTDAAGANAEAKVSVAVTPSSAPPPKAVADTARTTQGVAVSVDAVANDVDALGRGLVVVGVGVNAGSGTAAVAVDGRTVTFTPSGGFFGSAQLTYTVQDARRSEAGQAVGQITVDVIGLPAAPSTPQATTGNATATVTWAQGAANGSPLDDVQIQKSQDAEQSIGVTSSYAFTGLANGTAVQFRVRAHNEAGWGEWSQYSTPVTPNIEPGRPAAPSVEFLDGALKVTWTAPANEGSAITGYELTIGGGKLATQPLGNLTEYTWTGLTNGTSYQFSVIAVNAAGRSKPSAFSNVEHPLRQPDAPGVPSATQGDRFLDLAWSRAPDNGDAVIEYQVEQQSAPGVLVPFTGTSTRWSNLPNGVPQQFRVRARNRDVDWSVWSGWSIPVKPCGVPDAPAAPAAARGDQQAVVSFVAGGDQGCGIDQYQVSTGGGAVQATSGSPHAFTGLANGTSYQFMVRAHNSVGWGAWSGLSAAVIPAGPPTAPASLDATSSAVGAIDLTWAAANPNGASITGYNVSANGGTGRGVGPGTNYRWSALANGTGYTFRVQACNDVGCGSWSASAAATTWGEPAQPGPPSVSAGNATVNASWSAPAANGSAITGYNVDINPGGVAANADRTKTFTGLTNGVAYQVRAQACNAVGCGAWSGWSQSVTPQAPVSIRKGPSAIGLGSPTCVAASCAWILTSASGLVPGHSYTLSCHGNRPGDANFATPSPVTADGNGRIVDAFACFYGFPGFNVWVTVDSFPSNVITW